MPGFTHLHVASACSPHHGTALPEETAQAAAAQGAEALALTDRDGLYGAARHIAACLAAGLAPIVGADLRLAEDGGPVSEVTVLAHGHDGGAGWASLARLVSAAHSSRTAAARRRRGGPACPATARPGDSGQAGPTRRAAGRAAAGTPDGPEETGLDGAHRAALLDRGRPADFLCPGGQPTGTVLLGPASDVGQAVAAGAVEAARRRLADWARRLPDGVAVEVVCHHTRPGQPRSLPHAATLLGLARAAGVPAVLTNAVRYLRPDDAITGDVLDAADRLQPLGSFTPQPNGQAWLKPPAQMARLAQDVAEWAGAGRQGAAAVLAATERLAERCRLDPAGDIGWQRPKLPELAALGLAGQPAAILKARCEAALPELYPDAGGLARGRLQDRLDHELAVIARFGFETYFLAVADVVGLIRRLGSRVQARGSGASSLVNHLLGVSAVDPLEHDLVFERFLGGARSTLPDIDVDVEADRRHDIDQAVFARYGPDRVALLSMRSRYRARGAARDAGLALGLDAAQIERVAGTLWGHPGRGLRRAVASQPELRPLAALAEADSRVNLVVDLAERLDRLPRHIAMHPCGVILGDARLLDLTPVQPSGAGLPMSQFDKDDVDGLGLLKLDILGVRMQSAMAYTLREIVRVHGPAAAAAGGLPPDAPYVSPAGFVTLADLPHDDAATFQAICTTQTLGMFQIESPGQRELIGKLQPDQFADLVADISLFRPGPMKGNVVTPFLEAKHGFQRPARLHPRLEPFLRDAYGAVIYHEHILRILGDCMGVSLSEADEWRRAMVRHLPRVETAFRRRTAQRLGPDGRRLYSDADIDRIWAVLAGFGSFGFCKAHGAAVACTTYESAWLKTHYPAEFLAGLFEHDPGMYPRRLLVAEARRLGIPILPLDANASADCYRVEPVPPSGATGQPPGLTADSPGGPSNPPEHPPDGPLTLGRPPDSPPTPLGPPGGQPTLGIRLSFRDVRGISQAELRRVLAGQPYDSVLDFVSRAAPSRRLAARLAAVGALDSRAAAGQPMSRGEVVAYVRRLSAQPKRLRHPANQPPLIPDDLAPMLRDPLPAQPSLFDGLDGGTLAGEPTPRQQVAAELAVLSTEVGQHVVECYRPLLDAVGVTPAADLVGLRNNSEVFVAGVRVATQAPPMRSGQRVVFISLDDGSGCADCRLYSDVQTRAGPLLFGVKLLLVRGRTRRTGARGVSVRADQAWNLKTVWDGWRRNQRKVWA
ncbi:MAG: PHP domain-containing protein [Propionibacteriaceae bacterium]|jgi:error-prone DNA polymerase|nr:PHP domain-containing protein [Propionibacteriaceae bacterium]